jgi:cytochrome subunit of sulfide dehydrogenase
VNGRLSIGFLLGALLTGAMGAAPGAAAEKPNAAMFATPCGACHGTQGASAGSTIPTIGGQSPLYLSDTLRGFKSGTRPSSIMGRLARGYADADFDAMAEYFGRQTFVRARQSFDPALAAKGQAVHEKLCERCHIQDGRDFDDTEAKQPGPVLAGQWMQYLLMSCNEFIAQERKFPAGMDEAFHQLHRGDVEALAHFYASQQ